MSERAPVRIELWPLTADEANIWSLSGDIPWFLNDAMEADNDPHFAVEMELGRKAVADRVLAIHSTGWRHEPPAYVLTYVAVIQTGELARIEWHGARPITQDVFDMIGRPAPHGPTEKPKPTRLDTLMAALRELWRLAHTNDSYAFLLDTAWGPYLDRLGPDFERMYRRD